MLCVMSVMTMVVIGANIRTHDNVVKIGRVFFARGVRLGKKWRRTFLGR